VEEKKPKKKYLTTKEAGRRGGLRSSERMTPEERSERARKASAARWSKQIVDDGKL